MKGIIASFRHGHKTVKPSQVLINLADAGSPKSAGNYLGMRVVYKTITGRELVGRITGVMGDKGTLKARFNTPVPGQALGKAVTIE